MNYWYLWHRWIAAELRGASASWFALGSGGFTDGGECELGRTEEGVEGRARLGFYRLGEAQKKEGSGGAAI